MLTLNVLLAASGVKTKNHEYNEIASISVCHFMKPNRVAIECTRQKEKLSMLQLQLSRRRAPITHYHLCVFFQCEMPH